MSRFNQLTDRQRACLRAVADHRTYKEIARDLGISDSMVEKHLRHAREKLGVGSTAEAARLFLLEEGEAIPQGGFNHLPDPPIPHDEDRAAGHQDAYIQGVPSGGTHEFADYDAPLSPVQTLSLIGRLVLGFIVGLSLLIASAEGLKAMLT